MGQILLSLPKSPPFLLHLLSPYPSPLSILLPPLLFAKNLIRGSGETMQAPCAESEVEPTVVHYSGKISIA